MENKNLIPSSLIDWLSRSVMLKLSIIFILTFMLLLPQVLIKDLILDRQSLNQGAIQEVSGKWGLDQTLGGPILTVPVILNDLSDPDVSHMAYYHFLPDQLTIRGELDPETLQRGIYRIVVYQSNQELSGRFTLPAQLDLPQSQKTLWDQAFITIGLSDLRGVRENVALEWNDTSIEAVPGSRISELLSSAITFPVRLNPETPVYSFRTQINFNGSSSLQFLPVGKITEVAWTSNWKDPKFTGASLPAERNLDTAGFSGSWKILQINRNYPQSWLNDEYKDELQTSASGVELIQSLDDYQKSMRSIKYGLLIIFLTFLVFFLVEVRYRQRIHPFQYTLVGLALVLFYILLISLSEQISFNPAYLISTLVTGAMIYLYSRSVFEQPRHALVLVAIVLAVYGFVFVILQLTDYALLMGSVGLTIILAITMYQTRNIKWYES